MSTGFDDDDADPSSPFGIQRALSSMLAPRVNDEMLSDVSFAIGAQCFFAHKVILASWSRVWRAQFTGAFAEAEGNKTAVRLEDVDPDMFLQLLQFLYTDAISLTNDNALPFLALANRFEIDPLQDMCIEYISPLITVDSCTHLAVLADRLGCTELLSILNSFLAAHFQNVCTTLGFVHLPLGVIRDVLSSNEVVVDREECAYEALIRWIDFDLPNRVTSLAALLVHIRFPLMRPKYIFQHVEKNRLVMRCACMRELLLEAYRYHALCEDDQDAADAAASVVAAVFSPSSTASPEALIASLQQRRRSSRDLILASLTAALAVSEPASSNSESPEVALPDRFRDRGVDTLIFGPTTGQFLDCTGSSSLNHPLSHLRRKNEKYWLPAGNGEEAKIGIVFDGHYRLKSMRFCNRYALSFRVHCKRDLGDEWIELVPETTAGDHKAVKEVVFSKKPERIAGHLMITLLGRTDPKFHTSWYWFEVFGKALPVM